MNKYLTWVQSTLKAHAAGLTAAVTLLIADLHSAHNLSNLTAEQWYGIVGAFVAAFVVVHVIPNTPADGTAVVDVPSDGTLPYPGGVLSGVSTEVPSDAPVVPALPAGTTASPTIVGA